MTATAIIDVRILDTFEGAAHVKQLEDGGLDLVFAVEGRDDPTADELRGHGIVVQNAGGLKSREFWESVFEFVGANNKIIGTAGHYDHWGLQSVSELNKVPFRFVYNPAGPSMTYLGN